MSTKHIEFTPIFEIGYEVFYIPCILYTGAPSEPSLLQMHSPKKGKITGYYYTGTDKESPKIEYQIDNMTPCVSEEQIACTEDELYEKLARLLKNKFKR